MLRFLPPGRVRQLRATVAMTVLVSLAGAGVLTPAPSAASDGSDGHGGLHRHQHRVETRIDARKTDLDEISSRLVRAQARVDAAVGDLDQARADLAALQSQVSQATQVDQEVQLRLEQAVVRLRNARSDLARGKDDVETKRSELVGYAVSSYQNADLGGLNLGVGLDVGTSQEAVDNAQDVESVVAKQTVALQQLQAGEVLLTLTEQRVEDTKLAVQQRRQEAADNLRTLQGLEAQAASAARSVRDRLAALRTEQHRVAAAKQGELRRIDELQAERAHIQHRLRAIAKRRARRHHTTIATVAPASPASPASAAASDKSGGYLSYPVTDTYITSPYGMRLHPILHIWELHDGTDFHADCGTAVHAAAAGTVTEEYYNAGYGNRLMIDHGYVRGVSLATSYNHLTSFVAGVGAHVVRGQIIAFSGTTGYSTACHLHFMVYVNGATVDPVSWL
ncbi:MAG: peptidoglycan DD-metalloendopeptidase family protein [Nocardioidaceae bacterium]